MNFSSIKEITIPEGAVTKIVSAGVTLWDKVANMPFEMPTLDGNTLTITQAYSSAFENGTLGVN